MAIVYLAFNKVTEKCYVGQTSEPLRTRWRKHIDQALHGRPTRIGKAIRKYGVESFDVQTLCTPKSKDSLNNLERVWITLFQSTNENFGYNITSGGESVVITEEGIRKMRKSLTGRKISEEHRNNIAKASRLRWTDPEYKRKVSEKISKANLGKPKSDYHKKRMSEGRIEFYKKQKENSHACETH